MTDEQSIRTLIEQWADAVRRRATDGILAHHAADLVMFDVPPPLRIDGLDGYRESWGRFFAWSHDPVTFAIDDMRIVAGGTVGFAVLLMHCAGGESRGQDAVLPFRVTIGLERRASGWTIVHEHHSIPSEGAAS